MPELRVEHLIKKYKNLTALSDVTFSLDRGVYGLLGPNGAGKSTLMKLLTLQSEPTGGKILWNGTEIAELKEQYLAQVGYMPQQQNLYPSFTVQDFVYYMAALHGLSVQETKEKAEYHFPLLGLSEKRHDKIRTLSGGMKQRLLLFQAIMHEPQLLILDEPTAGLDSQQRIAVRNLIMKIAVNGIVLLATHMVQDVELIAKENLLLKNGELVARGTNQELCEGLDRKVFEKTIARQNLGKYLDNYTVSAVKEDGMGDFILRVVGAQGMQKDGFRQVQATLEDVSLYYFNEGKRC